MPRRIQASTSLLGHAFAPVAGLVLFALATLSAHRSLAADEFQELVNNIPRSANAVVLLNMEKAKQSPLGVKEGWEANVAKAFEAGISRVPSQAKRFVLAAQMDFEFFEPLWEAAVIDLDGDVKMERLARTRGGSPDTIEGLAALARPNDTYLVQLGAKRLAAMGPGNRQAVVRWIREVRKPLPPPLSVYLQKAAVYSDEAGSEIIMALDLEGVVSFERAGKYLKAHEEKFQEWVSRSQTKQAPPTLADAARVLADVQGARIGIRIGQQPTAKIVVNVRTDATRIASIAKPLLLQILADAGALIDDFQAWSIQVKGNEIGLAGQLSTSGLRRLLSVVESPLAGNVVEANASGGVSADPSKTQAQKSRDYFRSIVGMADDLKEDMKNTANLASTSLFFDKYAKRIERMPILGVDEELLQYSAFVANALRQATGSVKTMGIQSGVRQAEITSGSGDYGYGYDYRYGAYGAYGWSDPRAADKALAAERRVVKAQEKAIAATDTQQLRQQIIAATTDVRRKMTQKYQIEF